MATIRGAEDASSATTAGLVGPFPTVSQRASNSSSICVSSTVSTTARPYRVVLSPTFLLMAVSTDGSLTTAWDFFFFGDLEGTEPGDMYATAIHVGGSSGTSTPARAVSSCISMGLQPGKTYFPRSIDGTVSSSVGVLGASASATGAASFMTFSPLRPDMRAGYGGRIERERVSARCLGSATTSAGSAQIYQRGWIPNLWAPLHSGRGTVTSDDVHTDSAYAVGSQFVVCPAASNAAWILEISDTWSAP